MKENKTAEPYNLHQQCEPNANDIGLLRLDLHARRFYA